MWVPTSRDALGKHVEELMAALPREHASIHYDRSSLQAFFGGLTRHPIGAHWSEQRVGRDLRAATWFVIDLLRQDEGLSQKYPRALGDGVDGGFCRWLCSEGIGRYRLPSGASQTIRAAFASQPGLPVRRLIEDRGMGNPSFRVAHTQSAHGVAVLARRAWERTCHLRSADLVVPARECRGPGSGARPSL